MKKLIVGLLIALGITTIGVNVSATSIYDNVFTPSTTSIKLKRYADVECNEVDITNSWGGGFSSPANWISGYSGDNAQDVIDAFNVAVTNGNGWAISQMIQKGNTGAVASISPPAPNDASAYAPDYISGQDTMYAILTFNASITNYVGFTDAWGLKFAYMGSTDSTPTYTVLIFQDTDCNIKVYGSGKYTWAGYGTSIFNKSWLGSDTTDFAGIATNKPYFVNSPITYPESYEGEIPLDSEPQVETLETAPTIEYHIQDLNGTFNAKDIPETGADKLKWFITYGSIEGQPQVRTWEGEDIPQTPLEFTFPYMAKGTEDDIWGLYTIRAWYTDSEGIATSEETIIKVILKDDQFNNFNGTCTGEVCLDTPISGSAVKLNFDECQLSETYPFIDIDGCINKIKVVLGIINVDKIKYGENLKGHKAGCHTLTVFNNWLNLTAENSEVCPVFNEEIRNIITPFMMLGLGMITITFLGKHGEDKG
jgi:hypothetical protein